MHSKKVIQSKTIWFNVLSLSAILLADEHFRDLLGDYGLYLFVAQNMINMALRFVTREPISIEVETQEKKPRADEVIEKALEQEPNFLKDF